MTNFVTFLKYKQKGFRVHFLLLQLLLRHKRILLSTFYFTKAFLCFLLMFQAFITIVIVFAVD